MKKLKYLLFILPFLFSFNVFAKEVDVTSNCYGTTGYASMYSGHEVQYQTSSNYNFGTTYQFQLSSFQTELRYNLAANTDYIITFNTNNSNDFRNNFKTWSVYDLNNNNNDLVTGFTFVSMKKVQISFTTTSATNKVEIHMGGSNVYDNITGENNWNIKNAILTIPDNAPSGSTNQDVINNATNNTNTIVNNQNQNTSDIINNANQNSQNIIDNQNELLGNCDINNYISLNVGSISVNSGTWFKEYSISNDYISNLKKGTYFWGFSANSLSFSNPIRATLLIFYNDNTPYQEIDVVTNKNGKYQVSFNINSDNISSILLRFLRPVNDSNNFNRSGNFNNIYIGHVDNPDNISLLSKTCKSKIDDTNNYLKDDTDPSISDSVLNDVFGKVHFTDPLSYLLTLPTQLINKIVSLSDTCSSIDLGTLYGVSLTLPCINLENYLGSDLWNVIDIILSVGLLAVILKNFYDTIANLITLGGEKEAKEKFSMPTPMDFLAMILGGDRQ